MALQIPRIRTNEKHIAEIADKLKCTTETVRKALQYQTNSPLAQAIRKMAKSTLQAEANKIVINIKS